MGNCFHSWLYNSVLNCSYFLSTTILRNDGNATRSEKREAHEAKGDELREHHRCAVRAALRPRGDVEERLADAAAQALRSVVQRHLPARLA